MVWRVNYYTVEDTTVLENILLYLRLYYCTGEYTLYWRGITVQESTHCTGEYVHFFGEYITVLESIHCNGEILLYWRE